MSVDSFSQIMQLAGPLARALFTGVRHRGQLAALETGEARDHFVVSLAITAVVLLLALVTLFTGTLAIAALVWDLPNRAMILGGLALGYLAGAGVGAWLIARRMRTWQPLGESCRQLQADCDWLETLLPAQTGK